MKRLGSRAIRVGFAALIVGGTAFTQSGQIATTVRRPVAVGGDCAAVERSAFAETRDGPVTITAFQVIPAGEGIPEYCRVTGYVGPGKIDFELRMPTKTWNGRLLAQGSGGSGGNVNIDSCNDVLATDFAVVATDLGHAASDQFWTKDFQKLIDFSFRATHLTTVVTKELIKAYYGRAQTYAYFRGCSSGGRAAMVNAQRFPGDFDGIVAGDVGNPRAGAYFLPAWIMKSNIGQDGKSVLTQADLPKITAAVIATCAKGKAKEHGFLDDPLACKFDPMSIVCRTAEVKQDCISRAQAEFVQKVYDGPRNSQGKPVFLGGGRIFGLARGSEMQWTNWIAKDSSPTSAPDYATVQSWFQEQAFIQTPINRDFKLTDVNFDLDPDRENAIESLWGSSNPDLRALQANGVKLLAYSGWSDNRVQPEAVVDYYRAASAISGGAEKLYEFYRLFMIPGVGHCSGGPGADRIDWIGAIVDWVEHGRAPESVIGSHMLNGKKEFTYAVPRFKL